MWRIIAIILCVVGISLFACSESSSNESETKEFVEHSLDSNKINFDEETIKSVEKKGDNVRLVISSLSPRKIHRFTYGKDIGTNA
ncbi:MAG: hypothetical protein QF530_11240 [SAR202 cluster bacterium]|jgi:ABC-type glycerol-3-phosphate transport system substrate-binding protein|nr:hypothetical protein [SAR202 cluster bacterium]